MQYNCITLDSHGCTHTPQRERDASLLHIEDLSLDDALPHPPHEDEEREEEEREEKEREEEEREEEEREEEKEKEKEKEGSDAVPSFFLKKSLPQSLLSREGVTALQREDGDREGRESSSSSHPIAIPTRTHPIDGECPVDGDAHPDSAFEVHRSSSYRSISRRYTHTHMHPLSPSPSPSFFRSLSPSLFDSHSFYPFLLLFERIR